MTALKFHLHDQVGAHAIYMWRHRSYFGNARESLEHIARVVVLNMVLLDIPHPEVFCYTLLSGVTSSHYILRVPYSSIMLLFLLLSLFYLQLLI